MFRKKSRRLKIRKNRIWPTALLFLLMSAALFVVMLITGSVFISYLLDTKLSDSFETLNTMQKAWTDKGDKDPEHMSEFNMDCFILNNEGKTELMIGSDTCIRSASAEFSSVLQPDKEYLIYGDTESEVLVPEKGELEFKLTKFLSEVGRYLDENKDASIFTTGINSDNTIPNGSINIPIWISTGLSDGSGTIYARTVVSFNVNYVFAIIRIVLIVIVIYLVIFVLMLINVISNLRARNKLARQFYKDVTTGGNNRAYFFAKGEPAVRGRGNAKKRYAVLSIKLMNYLSFCVCHSVSEGEKLICRIYDTVNSKLARRELAAHFDSADFAALLAVNSDGELTARLGTLTEALESADSDHRLDFHIGAYMIDVQTDGSGRIKRRKELDLEECYNNALAARESLPESGGSAYAFFDAKLVEEQKWTDTVVERQQRALESEEFVVYYQPKYDPRTDELRGAEALIRWQSPELGFITPYRFIPIFERNGFITEIDHYMLTHVAVEQKRWLDQGIHCVPVSVNISRAHFIEENLAEQIRDTVDSVGTPHGLIEIELTESAFFDDKQLMIETITRLKSYGFTVSMDDFGSGYSSLNSLKDMPLDVLKLDAEFFRGENCDGRDRIVVAEAIRLARSLNMRTVAEGVEVREQVDFLAEQECDMIQGYYYAKPMPKEEFEARLEVKEQ